MKLLVTSSIGVARGWDSANGPVPERPLSDLNVEASSGYASSKYVVEKVRRLLVSDRRMHHLTLPRRSYR